MEPVEHLMLTLHDTAAHIAEFERGVALRDEAECCEKACAGAQVMQDWQDCIDTFGARAVGEFVADWADESAHHPHEPEGCAVVFCDDGAVFTEWNNQGFWDTSTCSADEGQAAIDAANAEWSEGEDEGEDQGQGED